MSVCGHTHARAYTLKCTTCEFSAHRSHQIHWCWELNPSPLQDQPVFWVTVPSLQPLLPSLLFLLHCWTYLDTLTLIPHSFCLYSVIPICFFLVSPISLIRLIFFCLGSLIDSWTPAFGQMLKILSHDSDNCILLYYLGVTIRELVFLVCLGVVMAWQWSWFLTFMICLKGWQPWSYPHFFLSADKCSARV